MKEIKPFDTAKKPLVPRPYLMPVEWIGSLGYILPAHGCRITKHGIDKLEGPLLLLSNHASMVDFPTVVKAVFPGRTNWVISIEEFVGREFLMRGIGGIYKRKFTSDLTVVRHILTVLKQRKGIVTMYPEARFSLAGINEQLDPSLGKLAKTAKCAVAVMILHGNFLSSPQWNKKPVKHIPVTADLYGIATAEEVGTLSAEEIQRRIEEKFVYDEYRFQEENGIRIKSKKRAHNIHRILYQCPCCGTEFSMKSENTSLWCEACGKKWEMDEYGRLHCVNGEETFTHVPDWYRFERENVRKEVREGRYHFEDTVRVEHLDNCQKGFRAIGKVKMTHDENGFTLGGTLDDGTPFDLHRSVTSMYSCHIEYDFKGRGDAIDLATLKDTWFVFPLTAVNPLTKIHFAEEELFRFEKEKKEAEEKKESEEKKEE